MEKFNQNDYIRDYRKKNYKQFKVELKNEEMEELNELLNEKSLNKTEFIKLAKDALKKGIIGTEKRIKEEMSQKLKERLEEVMKENPTKAISACRSDVVAEFKEKGIIKDYVWTKNRTSKSDKVIYFGSCVGFDSMYKIILN